MEVETGEIYGLAVITIFILSVIGCATHDILHKWAQRVLWTIVCTFTLTLLLKLFIVLVMDL